MARLHLHINLAKGISLGFRDLATGRVKLDNPLSSLWIPFRQTARIGLRVSRCAQTQ